MSYINTKLESGATEGSTELTIPRYTLLNPNKQYPQEGVVYDNISFSVQNDFPSSLTFSADGTKMYLAGYVTGAIDQYSLSNPFDLTTASYDNVSLNVETEQPTPQGLAFNNEGTKLYMTGYGNSFISRSTVHQYSLSNPFDLTTASYDNVSLNVINEVEFAHGLAFSADGTKMYVNGQDLSFVHQYTLSVAFDLSTASYDNISFDTSNEIEFATEIAFSSDGFKMYLTGTNLSGKSNSIYQYTLSNPFDISTASYDNDFFTVSDENQFLVGIALNLDDTKLFVVSTTSNLIYQYDISAIGYLDSYFVDTSHAIRVGDLAFSASNNGVADSSRVVSVTPTDNEITTIEVDKPLVSAIDPGTWLTFDRFQNAARGGKFSFSKFPVPSITDQVPLFDIVSGQVLTDQAGVELVTDTEIAVGEVASKDNATSVTVPTGAAAPSVPVEEIFQETSEVSNTLLGVPRAEEQLSLFSDVSTLGLNEDDWEFFTQTGGNKFGPWDTRESEIFGNHYNASFIEQTDEQALELGAFPVPYSYPFGERWANLGLYNEQRYAEYVNFIQLGNDLYTYFSTTEREALYGADFKNNFLDGSKVFINSENDTEFVGVSDNEGFKLIDTWTRTWVDINDGIFRNPAEPGAVFDPIEINRITESNPLFSNTRPGYNTNFQRFSYLQSKRSYRYQPGRVSGFTFGLRASSDSGSESNILEWGITNPTDQYVFQIRGATLNIVRRSTIPLDADVVRAQGLDPTRDQTLERSGDPDDVNPETGEPREYFTIAIPRDNWNVDPLNGNGPSKYLLTTEEVTMYKIEFSWYGAVGARFYVYTPAGNGEARWILVHVLVIENKLGQPCLEDPNFRFRYSLNIRDTARLRTPQFVYKYGASCYIDGGDEGTVTLHSYASGIRNINSTTQKSLLGVYPKEFILNQQGFEKENKKTIIPKSLNVTSTELAKIQIGKCKACPGFGHNYNLGLKSGQVGRVANFKFNDDTLSSITINPDIADPTADDLFQLDDNDAKIIADGIYSTYISVDEDSFVLDGSSNIIGYTSANLKRIVSNSYRKDSISSVSSPGAPTSGFDSSGIVVLNDGSTRNLFDYAGTAGDTYPDTMRLSKFSDAIAASDIPITGTEVDVQFLNPSPRDSGGVYSEFMIGITDKRPVIDEGILKFEVEPTVFEENISDEDSLFGEYTQSTTSRNRLGQERGETNFPFEEVFEIDYRIPQPEKEDNTDKSGNCSLARFSIQDRIEIEGTFTTVNPESGVSDGNNYLLLEEGFTFPNGIITGGEIGIGGEGSGTILTSEAVSFISDGIVVQYATVNEFPTGFSDGSLVTAELTPIIITGKHINKLKVFKFNPYPLYLFIKMRDNSEINSISVKESVGKTTVTSTPNWIFTSGSNINTDNSGGRAQPNLTPSNFIEDERLNSASIDNQNNQRLRPLRIKDSFYVGKQESKEIELDKIYGFDREVISPDIFDTEATFVVAETIDEPTGEIQVTLNTSEQ